MKQKHLLNLVLSFVLIVLITSPLQFTHAEKIRNNSSQTLILSTIKPIHLITIAISNGIQKTEYLLPTNMSPHSYHLKPSDIKKLHKASTVIWLGPELEAFLEKPLNNLSDDTLVIRLFLNTKLNLNRWAESLSEQKKQHLHDGHHHQLTSFDPHVWLDPDNALAIAEIIKNALSRKFPQNANLYEKNWQQFKVRLTAADQQNRQLLAETGNRSFFVFHDAWGYFTRHYKLDVAGVFSLSPERQAGALHINNLYEKIKKSNSRCILTEPQFNPRHLKIAIKKYQLKPFIIDPMAGNINSDNNQAYTIFIQQLAKTVYNCLNSSDSTGTTIR